MNFENLTGLSIERLSTFSKVAAGGSIKKAASSDPTRQSQFSRQIKELEATLEARLFDRSGKKWELTEEGRRLLLLATVFFQSIESLKKDVHAAKHSVRIGSGEGILAWYIIPKLESLRASMPGIYYECKNLRTKDIVEGLLKGNIEIGIIRKDALDGKLNYLPFKTIEYSFFIPRKLLQNKSAAGFELLREMPMVRLSGEGIFQTTIDNILIEKGIKPRFQIEADSFVLLRYAMNRMSLAGILPIAAKNEFSEEHFARIEIPEFAKMRRELVIAYNSALAQSNPNIESVANRLRNIS